MSRPIRRDALKALGALGLVTAAAGHAPHASAQTFPGSNGKISPRPKVALFLTRAAKVAREGFADRWIAQETPQLLTVRGLAALTVSQIEYGHSPDSPYDAVAELEFQNAAALDAWRGAWSAKATPLTAADPFTMVTWQVVILPVAPAPRGPKRFGIVGHPDKLSRDDFLREWRDIHAPDVMKPPGLSGYILNYADAARSAPMPWDGYAELWWPNWQAQAGHSAGRRAMNPEDGFFRNGPHVYAEERLYRELIRG